MNIGIIGGGSGGLAVLELLLSLPDVDIAWIADLRPDAAGMIRAKEAGILTIGDFSAKLRDENLNLVINVTGVEAVRRTIMENMRDDLSIMDAEAARLLVTLVNSREALFNNIRENTRELLLTVEKLNECAGQIQTGIEQLASEAERLAAAGDSLAAYSDAAATETGKTRNIIRLIENVARQTNIIGLNASIEAARAGDAGRGFSVVAEEIRKLSENTRVSTKQIDALVSSVKDSMEHINGGIREAGSIAQNQAASAEEILAVLETLHEVSQKLRRLTVNLSSLQ